MRQFVSPRFWLAIAALIGLTYGLWYVLVRKDDSVAVIGQPAERRRSPSIASTCVLPVYSIQADPGFAIVDGVANAEMHLALDATRTMVVKAGTPGPDHLQPARRDQPMRGRRRSARRCGRVVLADTQPATRQPAAARCHRGAQRQLGVAVERMGGRAQRGRRTQLRRRRPRGLRPISSAASLSTSTFSFEQQEIVKVTCLEQPENPTTTSTHRPRCRAASWCRSTPR